MARYEFSEIDHTELALAGGGSDALFNLGMMYSTGRTVEADLITAHKWFNLAAMQGNQAARDYRMEIAQELSRDQVVEAQRLAREWIRSN